MTNTNPWKHVDPGDISKNPYYKKQDASIPTGKPDSGIDPITSAKLSVGAYSFIEAKPYSQAVHKLQVALKTSPSSVHPLFNLSATQKVYRPLTFKENIEARINDFETKTNPDGSPRSNDDLKKLFLVYLDSCTGIAYKAESTRFKIDPECKTLITINNSFNQAFHPIDYSTFNGVELDSSKDVYNSLLSKSKFLDHEGYRLLYSDDKKLMNTYWDIVHSLKSQDNLMSFWVKQNTSTDELRALYVNNINNNSNANGNNNLNNNARFLLIIQAETPKMHLFERLVSYDNLLLAYRKARKHKTLKQYVIEFEKKLQENLLQLQYELITKKYIPNL